MDTENSWMQQAHADSNWKHYQGCDSLYQVALHNVQCAVEDVLRKAGIDPSVLPGLSHVFNIQGPHGRLFAGLESQHKQMKYLKSQFNLVVSCKSYMQVHKSDQNYIHVPLLEIT